MGDFVSDQTGASGVSRTARKLPDWWARLARLNPALQSDLVASILAYLTAATGVPAATVTARARPLTVKAQPMSSPQFTVPVALIQFVAEDITYGNDVAAVTATPTAVTVTLTDPKDAPVTLVDAPTVSGSVISQRVRANVLAVTQATYVLTFTYTPIGTTNILQSILYLECPQ